MDMQACGEGIRIFRMGVHVVLAVFFFAIWLGPGMKRRTWLLWTLAFVVDSVQGLLLYCGTHHIVGEFPLILSLALWFLTLVWLCLIVAASYRWRDEPPPLWGIGVSFLLMGMGMARFYFGIGEPLRMIYLGALMVFLGFLYWRVGGVLLALLGFWAGAGDAVSNVLLVWWFPERAGQFLPHYWSFWTLISVELASVALVLGILYLYLWKLCGDSLEYQESLVRANNGLHASLDVAVQLINDSTENV